LKNPFISAVITGASRVSQVQENMRAIEIAPKLTGAVLKQIDGIIGGQTEEA
jgi:aryl-alcohol dehydrogenase-like predicted oxidoreductase